MYKIIPFTRHINANRFAIKSKQSTSCLVSTNKAQSRVIFSRLVSCLWYKKIQNNDSIWKKSTIYFYLLPLFLLIEPANAFDIDTAPMVSRYADKGKPFFGISTGPLFIDAYRTTQQESLNALGAMTSIFAGVAYHNLNIRGGMDFGMYPCIYDGSYNSITNNSQNILYYPEFWMEFEYFITRKYWVQPFVLSKLAISNEISQPDGVSISGNIDGHFEIGGGGRIPIDDIWSITLSSAALVIVPQQGAYQSYVRITGGVAYKASDHMALGVNVTYHSPRLNYTSSDYSSFILLPAGIDIDDNAILFIEFSAMFF